MTVPFTPALRDVVKIWVPLVNCLETKPGFDPFCEQSPPLDAYAHETAQGKSLWFYQSCASHGCNITGGRYFEGWPSYMIDMQGPANRAMQWVAWKYRIEGELWRGMNPMLTTAIRGPAFVSSAAMGTALCFIRDGPLKSAGKPTFPSRACD